MLPHDREGLSLDLVGLRRAFQPDGLTALGLIELIIKRLAAAGDDHVWIARSAPDALRARAIALDEERQKDPAAFARLPLFGVPFAVKDNIDVAGFATTAGCPAFAYVPAATAFAVERLLAAGAIIIGKTNLDQFATGLVGTRSPYGVPSNPFDRHYVPGGSSSGSAVAVAKGLVSFALGTDTAGSGRVPAAFNNIVGLKPTIGIVSTAGVVPACRTLDCVSILALTAADAACLIELCAVYDPRDPYARPVQPSRPIGPSFRFAMPRASDREFFGDSASAASFARTGSALEEIGGTHIEIDFAPFRAAAALLYGGPWLAERFVVVEPLLSRAPEALLPVTREVIAAARQYSASDALMAFYRLAELRREAEALWQEADVLVVPTAGTIYTLDEVAAEPLARNTDLGFYTNFVNLLDLAAVALPAGFCRGGLPFGVSLIGPAFADPALLSLAWRLQRHLDLPLGATRHKLAGTVNRPRQ